MNSISIFNETCNGRREKRVADIPSAGAETSVATSFTGSGALATASPPIAFALSLMSDSSWRAGAGSGVATSGRGAAAVFASSDMVLSRNKYGDEGMSLCPESNGAGRVRQASMMTMNDGRTGAGVDDDALMADSSDA